MTQAAQAALAEADVPGQVLLLRPDMHGLMVDRDGGGDFWRDRKPEWSGTDADADPVPSAGGQFYDFDGDR